MPSPWTRIGLAAVLVGELLYLTVRFDTQGLDQVVSPWLRLVAWSPQLLRLAISVAAVFLLISARRLWQTELQERPTMSGRVRLFWCLVHVVALLAFFQISSGIFDGRPPEARAALWVSAWFLSALTMLASWVVVFLARGPDFSSVVANRSVAVAAAGIGVLGWAGGYFSEGLWRSASGLTFNIVETILGLFYEDVVSRPERMVLGTRRFRVAIAASCSGLEGVGLVLGFLGVYLWWFRRELRFPAALALLPIGAASIWLLNALRIVLLIAIGTSGWRDVALGGFHSQAGWITFNVVALGFVALVNRRGLFMNARAVTPQSWPAGDRTAAYLVPFMVVIATGMVTGALSSGLDWFYPLRVVAAAWALWVFRRHYGNLRWTPSWQAIVIGVATFGVWLALAPSGPGPQDAWPAALQAVPVHWAAAWLLFRVVGFTIAVPLVEELAFRAYLTRRLVTTDVERLPVGFFTWSSFAISSLLFGMLHGGFWLAGTIAGMSFALALYHRRAVGDAVLAHVTTNSLIAAYVLATGRWSVWS
jgi:exosortase E/protease (VPEID-CTERM system)